MSRRNNKKYSNSYKNLYSEELQDKMQLQYIWIRFAEALSLSRFKWEGIEDPEIERFLERTLMIDGKAVFFEFAGNLMATKMVETGPLNVYHYPTSVRSVGDNGWSYDIPKGKFVVCFDSLTRKPMYPSILSAIGKLVNIEIQDRVNLRQQKYITMFTGPEETSEDLARFARLLDMNQDSVIATENALTDTSIQAIGTGIVYKQQEYTEHFQSTMNRLFMILGIDHIPFEKNERLISGEASVARDYVSSIREDFLIPRQTAAKKINKMFGTDIKVTWRSDQLRDMLESMGGFEETDKEDFDE